MKQRERKGERDGKGLFYLIFFLNLFIVFSLRWAFVAMHRLSPVTTGVWAHSSCGVQASHLQ